MKEFNLSDWALRNRAVVIYLMLVAIVAGVFSFYRLGRNEDPSFIIKTMVVQASWPGASVEETLKQVTERLERTLQETPHLDFLRSFTRAGVSTIFVNLEGSTSAKEVAEVWYQVRKRVADMRRTLPAGLVGPGFNDEFGDTFGIIYAFTADGFTKRELRDYVEDVRSQLLNVKNVSKIDLLGGQDEQIFVEVSMARLASYGVDRNALIAALQAQNVVRPAGVVETNDERVSLRVSGSFASEQDIRDINFSVGGRLLRLGDIADVRRGLVDPPQPLFRVDGMPALGLAIAMREGGDILALGRDIKVALAKATQDLPVGIDSRLVADQAVTVDVAIADFMSSLWQSVLIILAVSFVSLGVRPGLIVALVIPLTLAIVFAVMGVMKIDMQRISLGALIIALALLVDDAMTTTDATVNRLAAGDDPHTAATFAYSNYAFAMLAGTLVTIAGFVPVGFAASSAGEYTYSLFAVVSITLVISWFVAVLFTPLFGRAILRPPAASAEPSEPGFVMRVYRGFLERAIAMRWITIGVTVGLFVLSILALPLVPRQFFPSSDRSELLVDLSLPQNASIHASLDTTRRFEDLLRNNADVERWSSYVGQGAIRFYLPLNAQLPNSFFSQIVIVAKDVAARERLQVKLEKSLAETFPELISRVYPLELGPPVGWPIQYRVSGPDLVRVREIALDLAGIVSNVQGTKLVNYDWNEPGRALRVRVDQDQARLLGLSSSTIASALATVVSGTTITQVRDDIYLVDVVVRATEDERASLSSLMTLQVPLPSGRTVALGQFATLEYDQEQPLVWRRNRVPTLTVQADVAPGVLPETVVNALAPKIAEAQKRLPPGYAIAVGGTVEESAKSLASVIAVVPLMLLIMLTVLMFQLRSFGKLALVLSVAPLGMIGVVGALLISNRPLGFVAILGIVALIGMIMKNAVILIGQIDAERELGKDVRTAVIDACLLRFRPIMLTAISTVLGMIPIAPTVFWGPMAVSIMGGLLVATVLTLIFLPVAFATVFERQDRRAEPAPVAPAA